MTRTDVEGLLRELAPQALGAVARRYGDFADAEDAVQEALISAAAEWPKGLPDKPLSWLIAVASRRLVDVESLDRALDIAARSSAAPGPGGVPIQQRIEVRQVLGAPDPEV